MKNKIKELSQIKKIIKTQLKLLNKYTSTAQCREMNFYSENIDKVIDEIIDEEMEKVTDENI